MSEQNKIRCCDTCVSFMEVLEEYREQYGCDGYCMHQVALSKSKELEDRFKRKSTDVCDDHMWAKNCVIVNFDEVEAEP